MLAIAVLFFFGVYLLITLWVISTTTAWARRNNRSPLKWGGLAAFVMYNVVFWDWLPTVVAHQYYCATEAGFTVYKTPEQWKAENPDLTAEDLKPLGENLNNMPNNYYTTGNSIREVIEINQRIYYSSVFDKNIAIIVPVRKWTMFIFDRKNNIKLIEWIFFQSGYGNPMTTGGIEGFKQWLSNDTCGINEHIKNKFNFDNYVNKLIKLGEKNDIDK